jgi:site-specific recombinase XerD
VWRTQSGNTYLFETANGQRYSRSYVSNQIAKLTQHVLGRKLSAHRLRNYWIAKQIQRRIEIEQIARMLGHIRPDSWVRNYYHARPIDGGLSMEEG